MTSKKLGALLRSVPPATAAIEEAPAAAIVALDESQQIAPEPAATASAAAPGAAASVMPVEARATRQGRGPGQSNVITPDRDVPLQVLIPASVRKELALYCTERSESLRSVMLQAIRSLGIEVSDADIVGKRARKNY